MAAISPDRGLWLEPLVPLRRQVLLVAFVAALVAIGANALLYACRNANPLIGADAWYFVGSIVRKASEGDLTLGDLFAKRSAFDHSQPLRKLVLLFHYRIFDLDFGVEAIVGVLAAFANLGLVWGIMRPATRSRHPAVAACAFAALAAVYLSLNASVVFDWSLLTLAYTGHAFVLCFFLACWWALTGTTPGRLALLAIAALAMDVVVDDTGLVATLAAALAVVMAGARDRQWSRATRVVATALATYMAYLLLWRWISTPYPAAVEAQPGLGTLLGLLWDRAGHGQQALLAPFSAAVAHPMQMRPMIGQATGVASVAVALVVVVAHAWFWWCAWRGKRNRVAFVASGLMLMFYGLVAGILVVRGSQHGLEYLWRPHYVVIYQWNIVALLMMGASQLPVTEATSTRRSVGWPALLACVAIALLLLQLPLSRHSWSGARYRSANQQRTALSLGALGRRAMRGEADPSLVVVDCRLHQECTSEVVRFLKANRLNIFSPAFQARNRLYPDARALPRLRPKSVRGGVQHLVQPVVQPHP